ncbi:hypothetical protein AAG906_007424 [Vitis piasezkii]
MVSGKGYAQHGVDYDDTFSPIARFETSKDLISLSCSYALVCLSVDVKRCMYLTEGFIVLVKKSTYDTIYMGSFFSLINEFKAYMKKKFEMSDLGLLHFFLGLEVKQVEDGVFVSQRKYVFVDLLKKFNMLNCKVVATPMNSNEKLRDGDGTERADARRFRSRFCVGVISVMHCPSKQHLGAAKRLLRYIAGTYDFGIWYGHVQEFKLVGYTDSDWAGCLEDRKSTSGYMFSLGSVWLRRILADINQEHEEPTVIYCDNKAAIAMTKNPTYHGRTKHVDIRVHFIRDLVVEGKVVLQDCNTNEQVADVLTKALSRDKHVYFEASLGCNFESRGVLKTIQSGCWHIPILMVELVK